MRELKGGCRYRYCSSFNEYLMGKGISYKGKVLRGPVVEN